jgi:restriction system protein
LVLLRYMGCVQEQLAEEDQTVNGAIIALKDDQRLRRTLAAAPNVLFCRYQVSFKLVKA